MHRIIWTLRFAFLSINFLYDTTLYVKLIKMLHVYLYPATNTVYISLFIVIQQQTWETAWYNYSCILEYYSKKRLWWKYNYGLQFKVCFIMFPCTPLKFDFKHTFTWPGGLKATHWTTVPEVTISFVFKSITKVKCLLFCLICRFCVWSV